jgi:hypothetical protein
LCDPQDFGHYQEAAIHLRHSLELKPTWTPAFDVLRDMGDAYVAFAVDPNGKASYIHFYTLIIIVLLVLAVLMGIVSSVDGLFSCDSPGPPGTGSHHVDVTDDYYSNGNGVGNKRHGQFSGRGKWRRS